MGNSKVETAPYTVIQTAENVKIELRQYDHMVLVSTPMIDNEGRNNAFRTLFAYISGNNINAQKIEMTAPVFMDKERNTKGTKIPMTAPVLMDNESKIPMMSFVMPKEFTLETTPKPTNPKVLINEIKDYTVATIQFNGRLTDNNIQKHKEILNVWISEQGYETNGTYKTAGYNAPFVLPILRRNEVLIEIKKP